jgi:hypothetical protein
MKVQIYDWDDGVGGIIKRRNGGRGGEDDPSQNISKNGKYTKRQFQRENKKIIKGWPLS